MPGLEPTLIVEFTLPGACMFGREWRTAALSVGHDGAIHHLCREIGLSGEDAGSATCSSSEGFHYCLQVLRDEGVTEYDLGEHPPSFSFYQPLGPETGLLVNSRCWYLSEGVSEKNAVFFNLLTRKIAGQFTFGDGIAHVQSTPAGYVWCGFTDEGIFGNRGWGEVGGPPPLGASGLVAYDTSGQRRYAYAPPADNAELWFADCYSMNVVGEDVWLCPYPDFPLIRVSAGGDISWWQMPPVAHGHGAFAIDGNRALFLRGEGLVLLELQSDHQTQILQQFDSVPLSQMCTGMEGRGKYIYLYAGTSAYSIAIP